MEFLHTKWSDVQRLCEIVTKKVVKADYQPDMITAISRGGSIPARILCDLLNVKELTSIGVEYYTSVKETIKRPVVLYPLNANVKGKKILLVDDVTDKGDTLVIAKNHVLKKGADIVKIATLHYKPWSVYKPDFYAEITKAWVVYVWEERETVNQLFSKFRNEGKNANEAKRLLLNIGFKEKTLRDLLE